MHKSVYLILGLSLVSVSSVFCAESNRLYRLPTASADDTANADDRPSEKPRLGDLPNETEKKNTPAPVEWREPESKASSDKQGEKQRLGDIPDESDREKRDKKSQPSLDTMTPEERKSLLSQVAKEFFEKGEKAYHEGRLSESKDLFERVLTLQPNHIQARMWLDMVSRRLEPPVVETKTPVPAKDTKSVLISKLETELDQRIKNKSWDRAEVVAKNILAVDPSNAKTKSKLSTVHRNLALRAINHGAERENAGDLPGAVDAYRLAQSYTKDPELSEKIDALLEKIAEVNSKKSDDLYREALDASQAGQLEKAYQLCQEALELNPDNIHAQRMMERLKSRIPS